MPGISLYCSFEKIYESEEKKLSYASELMRINDRYRMIDLYQSSHVNARFTAYCQYPRTLIDDDDYLIFIEGCIYNKSAKNIETELKNIAPTLFPKPDDKVYSNLSRWLLNSDGEYIVVSWWAFCQRT
jgi:hypothetical protein